jgi:16S rRNA (guanine966-N2)-methyltransferase
LRIIGGELKGRKLFSVRGTHTRPTADRIREAIFNILASRVPEAIVLDLFAGTGTLGLEALSRGAQRAIFIEANKHALSVLRRNIKVTGLENKAIIIQWNILKNLNCLQSLDPGTSLVFMDPPYDEHLIEPTLFNLHDSGCLRANACVTIEHSQSETIPQGELPFHQVDQRSYGKTLVSFLRYVL